MTANIKIRLTDSREFLLVPASAVTINPASGKTAVVVGLDNTTQPIYKDVETGVTTERGVEITAGLAEGDTVMFKRTRYVSQSANNQDEGSNPFMPKGPGANRRSSSGRSGGSSAKK